MPMKLYKYRAITDCYLDTDFKRIKIILQTAEFHMAEWKDLNDPMEGYFYHYAEDNRYYKNNLKKLLTIKYEQRICCFSGNSQHIFLWANYTNNFKGLAIEITVEKNHPCLYRVVYQKEIPIISVSENTISKRNTQA